ncbi:hypothetical protein BpHYR1_030647 [Brachionus plicatilis]|uniref:Uncharacterized protein n=1 Tax=Brachionus plicatilis TaxID=10195 RepID=A0A3M7Q9M9_BRAPC|nr:hypothetical protein BpHYR1_030647 [Brachionus plicatilis]
MKLQIKISRFSKKKKDNFSFFKNSSSDLIIGKKESLCYTQISQHTFFISYFSQKLQVHNLVDLRLSEHLR